MGMRAYFCRNVQSGMPEVSDTSRRVASESPVRRIFRRIEHTCIKAGLASPPWIQINPRCDSGTDWSCLRNRSNCLPALPADSKEDQRAIGQCIGPPGKRVCARDLHPPWAPHLSPLSSSYSHRSGISPQGILLQATPLSRRPPLISSPRRSYSGSPRA